MYVNSIQFTISWYERRCRQVGCCIEWLFVTCKAKQILPSLWNPCCYANILQTCVARYRSFSSCIKWVPSTYLPGYPPEKHSVILFIFSRLDLWFICSSIVDSVERIVFCESFTTVFTAVFDLIIKAIFHNAIFGEIFQIRSNSRV